MRHGFNFIWPAGEKPYFILPDNRIVVLEVVDDIPYLVPGSETSQPRTRKGRKCYACGTVGYVDHKAAPGVAGSSTDPAPVPGGRETSVPVPPPPEPFCSPEDMAGPEEVDATLDVNKRRGLRVEARSVPHFATRKPRNPYCPPCVRAKMTHARRYKGSFRF